MRKLISNLFISLDGVVEAPDRFLRPDLYEDLDLIAGQEALAEQDAVLLGRKQYEEWAAFWPGSDIEPFASFINGVPKHVVSGSLRTLGWEGSHLLAGPLQDAVADLKGRPGKTIGVHGSISLVQSLLVAGLLDELRFILCPAVVGHGRRLLTRAGEAIQLDLLSARTTPRGLQHLVFRPHA